MKLSDASPRKAPVESDAFVKALSLSALLCTLSLPSLESAAASDLRVPPPTPAQKVEAFSTNVPPPADYVFWDGKIYPMQSPESTAPVEAIAVRGERIVFVGSKSEAAHFISGDTKVVELGKRTIIPGMTDAHIHLLEGGLLNLDCNLSDATSVDKALSQLAEYAKQHSDKKWIKAANLPLGAEGVSKHLDPRTALDKLFPDRPAYVVTDTGHSAWANSIALKLAGIDDSAQDAAGSTIGRRGSTREPNGWLLERGAYERVANLVPGYSFEEKTAAVKNSIRMLNSFGIVNIIEARTEADDIRAIFELAKQSALTAHLRLSLLADVSKGMQTVAETLELKRQLKSTNSFPNEISLDAVKIFLDGTVEDHNAALENDYSCCVSGRGIPRAPEETVRDVIVAFDRAGMQIHVHAIGDRAVRMALDGFEAARKINGARDSRHHIAHLQVINPRDVPRFAELGVAANFQAIWASGDHPLVVGVNPELLGPVRVNWQYPIGAVFKSGGALVFGSDWPVTSANPFLAVQTAVTRRGPDHKESPPWLAEQLITVPQAIDGFTRKGAWISFRDDMGTLKAGNLADLVVLNGDVLDPNRPKTTIMNAQVEETMFRGKVIYTSPEKLDIKSSPKTDQR